MAIASIGNYLNFINFFNLFYYCFQFIIFCIYMHPCMLTLTGSFLGPYLWLHVSEDYAHFLLHPFHLNDDFLSNNYVIVVLVNMAPMGSIIFGTVRLHLVLVLFQHITFSSAFICTVLQFLNLLSQSTLQSSCRVSFHQHTCMILQWNKLLLLLCNHFIQQAWPVSHTGITTYILISSL